MGRGEITRAGAGEKVTRFALCSRFPAISPLKKSLWRREKQTSNVEHKEGVVTAFVSFVYCNRCSLLM